MNLSAAAIAPTSIDALVQALQGVGYFADRRLATAVFLALKLQRPLLLEGEPGVGKTALAQALAKVLTRTLIRLQCYDGLEQREALYEWNYAAQLLHMRAAEGKGSADMAQLEREVTEKSQKKKKNLSSNMNTFSQTKYCLCGYLFLIVCTEPFHQVYLRFRLGLL